MEEIIKGLGQIAWWLPPADSGSVGHSFRLTLVSRAGTGGNYMRLPLDKNASFGHVCFLKR